MEKMPLLSAPGYYCALGYWLAAVLFIRLNSYRRNKYAAAGIALLFLFLSILFSILTDTNLAIYFLPCFSIVQLMMLAMIYLCCDISLSNAFYFTIRAFILGEFMASLEWQLYTYYLQGMQPENTLLMNAVFLLLIHGCCFLVMYLLERRYREYNARLQITRRELISSALMAVAVFLFSNISNIFKDTPFSSGVLSEILLIRTLVDLGGVIMMFAYHMQMQDMNDKLQIQMLQQMMESQYANYQMSEQSVALINQKYHDLKHQIEFLRSDITSEEKLSYLGQMEQEIRAFEAQNHTGNQVLDIILTAKSLQCQNQGIQLTCVADGRYLDFMNPMDISALFGNMLDNAIESVANVKDKERRWIHLAVRRKMDFLIISVSNSYEGDIQFQEGLPLSQKQDKRYHGFGTKSIQDTIKRYGGTVTFRAENGWFEVKATYSINSLKIL